MAAIPDRQGTENILSTDVRIGGRRAHSRNGRNGMKLQAFSCMGHCGR
jgi:hypothetical protein